MFGTADEDEDGAGVPVCYGVRGGVVVVCRKRERDRERERGLWPW